MSLHRFCREAGISDVTAWRWRRRGWLATINICGKQYITDKGLVELLRRAESGEFAKQPKVPKPER
jgi:predicted site-specific integrase-resolvase